MTTNVKVFRKQFYDHIDKHRNEVLMNFHFSGKLLKNGTTKGMKRDEWIENDVMKRIWEEGKKYLPKAVEECHLTANWNFSISTMMYSVNFVWYDVKNHMTYACVRVRQGTAYKEKSFRNLDLSNHR